MSNTTYFPIDFLALCNKKREDTMKGLYLRWFVKPYLGIIGISPWHSFGEPNRGHFGFRIFQCVESGVLKPNLVSLPLDEEVLPEEPSFKVTDVYDPKAANVDMKAFYHRQKKQMMLTLKIAKYKIRYLQFNYALFQGQKLKLEYFVYNSDTKKSVKHQVSLDYPALQEHFTRSDFEYLSYAIHVDSHFEYIQRVTFITNGSLEIGGFQYATAQGLPFYIWSPKGGEDYWEEITSHDYALRPSDESLIAPVPENQVSKVLREFYARYYRINLSRREENQISFDYPALPGMPPHTEQPTRQYNIKQYTALIKGKRKIPDENGTMRSDFYISSQDAAALASNDPAIAYLFGLFRVLHLNPETNQERYYKVQGTWPDGKRFCVYTKSIPGLELTRPRVDGFVSAQKQEERVIFDYGTFRNHRPINANELSWKLPEPNKQKVSSGLSDVWMDPAGYLIFGLCTKNTDQTFTLLSPFYIPQKENITIDPSTQTRVGHYLDWYDYYEGTDINKILNGEYEYYLAGLDIFGQISDFETAKNQVTPLPISIGEILKPEICLLNPNYQGELESNGADQNRAIEVPLEVELEDSLDYRLKPYGTPTLKFEFSFFWPWESRYIWSKNRMTNIDSLDKFQLFYSVDIPLFAHVVFYYVLPQTDAGITVELRDVKAGGSAATGDNNSELYELLKKVGGVKATGQLDESTVTTALQDGTITVSSKLKITQVDVYTDSIRLTLLPADGTAVEDIDLIKTFALFGVEAISMIYYPIKGILDWNLEALSADQYTAWKKLSLNTETIQPAPLQDYTAIFKIENKTPGSPVSSPSDLQSNDGILTYQTPTIPGDYGFSIKLPKNHSLCEHYRFQLIPNAKDTTLKPGEYKRSNLSTEEQKSIPVSATTLFNRERFFAFYLTRQSETDTEVVYRGEPLSFISQDEDFGGEYLLYPDPEHDKWRVVLPNKIIREIPLSEFLSKPFNEDNYLTASLSIAVKAIVNNIDKEVKDSFQRTVAIKKLSFKEYLPPPELEIPDVLQPDFGIAASSPGYDGNSIIGVKKIFTSYDLEQELETGKKYFLYRLPAGRISQPEPTSEPEGSVGAEVFSVEYAEVPETEGVYKRNMVKLKLMLNDIKGGESSYMDSQKMQECFRLYAEKVDEEPLEKETFIRLPVVLPGESQTVYLFSIRAYAEKSGKESNNFACLSKPIYVEDTTSPKEPFLKSVEITRVGQSIDFTFLVVRKINPVDGFGYISDKDIEDQPDLLGRYFPHFTGRYRIYVTNIQGIAAQPDESDFVPVEGMFEGPHKPKPIGGSGKQFAVKLPNQAIQISKEERDKNTIRVQGRVTFSDKKDLDNMPSQLYICLRAGNYLGEWSQLKFTPTTYRDISSTNLNLLEEP